MDIHFPVGEQTGTFRRDAMMGTASLTVGTHTIPLQDPRRFTTHFNARLTKTWQADVEGHAIEIEMQRPLMLGGARKKDFVVRVDGREVARANSR